MNNTVKTIYTENALVNFKRFTLTKKSIFKPALLYLFCIAVIICSFIYNGKFEFNFTTILYPSLAIVCSILISVIYYSGTKSGNDKLVGKEVNYTFADDGIETDDVTIPYEEIEKVFETQEYFYFYTTENDGFYLEKDKINFDLSSLLKDKIKDKKVLKLSK